MLQQIDTQHFEGSEGPLHIDDSQTLVEHGQHCSLQIFCVGQLLDPLPFSFAFALEDRSSGVGLVDAHFNAVDFLVPERFRLFNALDKVVVLENSSVGMHLDHIHVVCFFGIDLAAGDQITDVDAGAGPFACLIVEEDMLGEVVSLIDQEWFTGRAGAVSFLPRLHIIFHNHDRVLLQCLDRSLVNVVGVFVELDGVVVDQVQVGHLRLHVSVIVEVGTYHSWVHASHEHAIIYIVGLLPVHSRMLLSRAHPQLFAVLAAVEFHDRLIVASVECWMLT